MRLLTLTIEAPRSGKPLIGEYELWVVVEGGDHWDEKRFRLEVACVEEDVETSLTLDRPPDVAEGETLTSSGMLTVDGTDEDVSGALVEIYDEDSGGSLGNSDDLMASGMIDEDGYF